jgi:dCTP deaminase
MNSNFQRNPNSIEVLLFEVLERIAIFYLHLQETDKRFFSPRSFPSSDLRSVDSFKECLSKILHCAVAIASSSQMLDKETEQASETLQQLMDIISTINELHKTQLGHLPRPPEPPELKRFGRILQKHALKLEKTSEKVETLNGIDYATSLEEENKISAHSDICIYLDEDVTETVFAGDPLAEFKISKLNKIVDQTNKLIKVDATNSIALFPQQTPENLGYHLTVPRMDATNPCRWPTLVHELGHRIMKVEFFKSRDIEKDFKDALIPDQISLPTEMMKLINLRSWLTESWCDLFGAMVMGPSLWFAQWSAFLFNWNAEEMVKGTKTHPPALFRLHLIYGVLSHRFPDALSPEFKRTAREAKLILEKLDAESDIGFMTDHSLRTLVLLFQDFFFHHIFRREAGELILGTGALNDNLNSIIKYTKSIEANIIQSMVDSLANGLPIPAVLIEESAWQERPSTVQEILLSAWIYRNTEFRINVLNKYSEFVHKNYEDPIAMWNGYVEEVVKLFREFNFSVLRSIQVSEWVDLFSEQHCINEAIVNKANAEEVGKINSSVLVDYQIYNQIKSKKILVIPIMNIEKQLGSSSLDIRLGTSFQIYYPNQIGVIDFTDDFSIKSANVISTLVDLDFLDYITIAPGQFMLGHSMEYICLPESIAAQVDGRSSFARLGLEVHMTAGFVDPGFRGVLTFEIYNAGPNAVRLYPGLRIGQLRFFHGSEPGKPYNQNSSAKYRGLLQHINSLQFQDNEVKLLKTAIEKRRQGYEC